MNTKIISQILFTLAAIEFANAKPSNLFTKKPFLEEMLVSQEDSPYDSLDNNVNFLQIQENTPDFENVQFITEHEVVYVTLDPETVYVTITEAPNEIATVQPDVPVIVTTTDVITGNPTLTDVTKPIRLNSKTTVPVATTVKEIISSVIVIETETAIETSFTTQTVAPASTNSPVVLTSTKINDLKMILDDGQKYTHSSSANNKEASSTEDAVDITTTTFQVTDATDIVCTTFCEEQDETKAIELTTTSMLVSTPGTSLWTSTLNDAVEIVSTKSPEITPILRSSMSFSTILASSSDYYPLQTTNTSATLIHSNVTGFDQLLENFSPYRGLPTADYTLANGASNMVNYNFAIASFTTILVGVFLALM